MNNKQLTNLTDRVVVEDIGSYIKKHGTVKSLLGEYYSFSFIKAWDSCPAKLIFKALYEDEQIEPPYFTVGSIVHEYLEKLYSTGESPEVLKREAIEKGIEAQLDEKYQDKLLKYIDAYHRIDGYEGETGRENHYTEAMYEGVKIHPFSIQPDFKIKGIIDRIDTTVNTTAIIDYKTSSRNVKDDRYLDQLIFYKWIVEAELGVTPDRFLIALLYPGDPRYIEYYPDSIRESMLVEKLLETDRAVKKALATKEYKKNPSYICRFCEYADKCKNLY